MLIRVSPECVLPGSVTLPPGEKVADVQSQVSRATQDAANGDDWLKEHPPRPEWLVGISGAETPTDHPLYQTVSQAIVAVTGCEPHVNPMHTASDIRNPMLFKDIATVGLGPLDGDLSQTGGHDEWVDVEEYIKTVKVVGSIILNWCSV
jgi:acetylornithine deacetylase